MSNKGLWRQSYLCLIVANALVTVSYCMFTGLLAVYVNKELGFGNSVVGTMAAWLGVSLMALKLLTGPIIDRVDKKRILLISTVLVLLNTLGYFLASDVHLLFFLRVLNGAVNGLFIVSSSTLVALVVDDAHLESAVTYYRVTSSLTASVGPVLGNMVFLRYGFTALFTVMTVLVVISLALIFLVKSADIPPVLPDRKQSLLKILHPRNLIEFAVLPIAAVVFIQYFSISSATNFLIAYGNSKGIPNMSLFFMADCAFMLLAQPLHRLLKWSINDKLFVAFGLIMIAAALAMIPLVSSLAGVLAIGSLYGLGEGFTMPLLNAMALRKAAPSRKGVASSTFSIANGIGTSMGSDLWGGISEARGYSPIFRLAALCSVIASMTVFTVLREPKESKAEEA